jgi:transcriptional regulator with XRE-family HTH domain
MNATLLLERARRSAGLSQDALARLAGTSRPTLSAYEHGRKSPTLATAARLLAEAGFELAAVPRVTFTETITSRGRVVAVPSALPRLSVRDALATVTLPLHLAWSGRQRREYRLADRGDRARVYEVVLREGGPEDVRRYVDGALLVDLWDDLVLPREVRAAWAPVVAAGGGTE